MTDRINPAFRVFFVVPFILAVLLTNIFGQNSLANEIHNNFIETLTIAEKDWLKNHSRIRMGVMDAWPPISYQEQNEVQGIDVEYVKLLNNRLNGILEIHSAPFKTNYELVKNKQLDAIMDLTPKSEREQYFNFTAPYLTIPHVIVGPSIGSYYQNEESLLGKTLALEKGFGNVKYFQDNFPQVTIKEFLNTQLCIDAVARGEADAYAGNRAVAIHIIEEELITNLKIHGRLNKSGSVLAIGTRKDWPQLASILNKALKSISLKEKRAVLKNWVETPSGPNVSTNALLTAVEQEWIAAHPVVRVHNEMDWPPFNFFEFGTPRGLSIDYMNLLAKKLGLKIEYITGPSWNEFLKKIKNKDLDLMLNIVKTEDRTKFLLFTDPYIRNPNVIVSPEKKPYTSISQLDGKTVAVPKGFYQEEILKKHYPNIKLVLVKDVLDSLKTLNFGGADATLGEQAVIEFIIQRNMLSGLSISGEIDVGNMDLPNLRIGIRDDWPLLHSAISKAMADISPLEMKQIQQIWIQSLSETRKKAEIEKEGVSQSFLISLLGIVIAVGLMLLLISWIVGRLKKKDISNFYDSKEIKTAGLIILALSVAIVILLAFTRLMAFRTGIENEITNRLQIVLNTSHQMLKNWVEEKKRDLVVISSERKTIRFSNDLLKVSRRKEILESQEEQLQLQAFLSVSQQYFNFENYYVLAPDMTIISSFSNNVLGRKDFLVGERRKLIKSVFLGDHVMIPPVISDSLKNDTNDLSKPKLFFAGPITDGDGLIVAVMALEYDPSNELTRNTRPGQLGNTGETYLFDSEGFILTESRFRKELQNIGLLKPNQSAINRIKLLDPGYPITKTSTNKPDSNKMPLTYMAQKAISGSSDTNIEGYRDYRGVKVVGSWLWDEVLNVGIASELDWDEAFYQYQVMRNTLVLTLAVALSITLILTGLSLWISQSANRSLTHAKEQLEIRVEERTADLARVEKRFRDLLESAPDSMIIVDQNAVITLVNAQTEKLFGYNRDEMIGQEIELVVPLNFRADHPAKRNAFIKEAQARPTDVKRDFVALKKSGEEFPVEISLKPLQTDQGLLVSAAVRDITERVQAEEALRESEEKNRLILQCVGEGIFGVDLEGCTNFINQAGCTMLGFSELELLGKKIHNIIHYSKKDGSSYPVDDCPMKKAYVESKTFYIDDEVLWKKDGTPIDVVYTSTPIIKDGNTVGAVITFRDVTEKRIAEEELKASESRFRAYFEYSQIGMAVSHLEDGWLEINKRLEQMFGYTLAELNQLTWEEFIHPDDFDEDTLYWEKLLKGDFDNYTLEIKFINKFGDIVLTNMSVACVRNQDGSVDKILASYLDITESKKNENELKKRFDELARFRKMAVGRELKMIDLKKEVNELSAKAGQGEKYKIVG